MAYPKITKRKDGRFEAKVSIGKDPRTNKVIRKSIYGKTKTEVKRKIDEITEGVIKGEYLPTMNSKRTVAQWCDEYLEVFTTHLTHNSYVRYQTDIEKYIKPYLGNLKLTQIGPIHCQQFVNSLNDNPNLHSNTVNTIVKGLKRILNKACTLGYLSKNPAENIVFPKRTKPDLNPFTEEEAALFIEHCPNSTVGNLFRFAIFTGLRISEILALTWNDVDNNKMIISHQFARKKLDTTFYPTKNKKSRCVQLSQNAINVLDNQKRNQVEIQLKSGVSYRNDLNLIFTDKKGKRLALETLRRYFKIICEEIGCPKVRIHDLRHTYAVLNLKAGVDVKTISESLGHHSVYFTLDQYAYVTNQMKEEAADKFDDYLNQYIN